MTCRLVKERVTVILLLLRFTPVYRTVMSPPPFYMKPKKLMVLMIRMIGKCEEIDINGLV